LPTLKKNWESNSQNLKPSALSIEENNTFYGQNKYSKPNPTMRWMELKTKIKTVFHHLTKDELIEKLLANYLLQNKNEPVENRLKDKNEIVFFSILINHCNA
jgi:ATP-dependent RNA helicase DeaD